MLLAGNSDRTNLAPYVRGDLGKTAPDRIDEPRSFLLTGSIVSTD
jgi:hypothetical protein